MKNEVFVNNIIKVLKLHPDYFSAIWFNGVTLDKSVRSKNGVVIYCDGSIIHPIRPYLSDNQKEIIARLIKPIFEKDTDIIVKEILKNII